MTGAAAAALAPRCCHYFCGGETLCTFFSALLLDGRGRSERPVVQHRGLFATVTQTCHGVDLFGNVWFLPVVEGRLWCWGFYVCRFGFVCSRRRIRRPWRTCTDGFVSQIYRRADPSDPSRAPSALRARRRHVLALNVLGGIGRPPNTVCSAATSSTGWSWGFCAWRGSSTESGKRRRAGKGRGTVPSPARGAARFLFFRPNRS